MRKLKVLRPGLISPFQNFQYELDKKYKGVMNIDAVLSG